MRLIPLTLEFSQVEPNFCAEIRLETPGAVWAIDSDAGDTDIGFSCNDTIASRTQPVSVQSIEVTKSILSVHTGTGTSGAPLNLTAVLSVPADLESFNGYCTLNDDARVNARFGGGRVNEWRAGHIAGDLPGVSENLQFISLAIGGWTGAQSVAIDLTGCGEESIQWALDPGMRSSTPFKIYSSSGRVVPVGSLSFTPRTISLFGCTNGGGMVSNAIDDLRIEAYIEHSIVTGLNGLTKPRQFKLGVRCDPDITVVAQMPGQYPQYLTSGYKTFSLA